MWVKRFEAAKLRLIIIDLDPNGAGVDFWEHTSYRLKIDDEYVAANVSAYDVLERIEEEMKARAYRPPADRTK
jgi:hypothetical protein